MRENLANTIRLVFGHEGGYVNVKTDRGGPTKYGITYKTLGNWRKLGRPATADEVKKLTLTEAEDILREQYAKPIAFDDLPKGLDYAVFDFSVNSGPGQAARTLQKVLGVIQDGSIGPNTIAAVKKRNTAELISAYCDARMKFLRKLGGGQGFSANGRGWTIRVTGKDPKGLYKPQPGVIGNALRMAGGSEMVHLLSTEMPEEALAPASSSNTKITSTTQGKGVATVILGTMTAQIDQAKAIIEPLTGTGGWIETGFHILTFGGIGLAFAGAAVVIYGIVKNVSSGTPQ